MSRDAVIDLCLVVIANILTHTPVVSWPVELLALLVRTVPVGTSPLRRRLAFLITTLVRLAAATAAFRAMRKCVLFLCLRNCLLSYSCARVLVCDLYLYSTYL